MLKHKYPWKLLAFITISFSIAAVPALAQGKKTVKVFLLGGQSNMNGGAKAAQLKPPYNSPFQGVKIWSWKKKEWSALTPRSC